MTLLPVLEKLHASFRTMLAYLTAHHALLDDAEKRKTVKWIKDAIYTWPARVLIAGCIDILRECWRTKNKLEQKLLPHEVAPILDALKISLRTLAQKRSVFCDLFLKYTQEPAGNDAEVHAATLEAFGEEPEPHVPGTLATAFCIEEALYQYSKVGRQRVFVCWTPREGFARSFHVDIPDFENNLAVQAVFKKLSAFATSCWGWVAERYPTATVVKGFEFFEPTWEFSQPSLASACAEFSKHWGFDPAGLKQQMRHLHSCRVAQLQAEPLLSEQPAALWAKVLSSSSSDDTAEAEIVVQAGLTTQTQSAVNERSFAAVESVKQFCGAHTTSDTINKYVWIMSNGDDLAEASKPGGMIDIVLDQWFAANPDRRFVVDVPEGFRKHGRKVVKRVRAKIRSDINTRGIRKQRVEKKKWAQLRECEHARGFLRLRRSGAAAGSAAASSSGQCTPAPLSSVCFDPVAGAEVASIDLPASPPRARKKKKRRSRSSSCSHNSL